MERRRCCSNKASSWGVTKQFSSYSGKIFPDTPAQSFASSADETVSLLIQVLRAVVFNRPLTSSHIESRTHRIIIVLLLLPSPPFKLLPKFSLAHILCNSFHRLSPTSNARGRTVRLHFSPNLIRLIAGFTF